MKFSIQNIGSIKEANINLKPLTVFVGKNNVGKSWVGYIISGIFTAFSWGHYNEEYENNKLIDHYPELDEAIKKLFSEGTGQLNFVDFCLKYYVYYINDIAQIFPTWLNEFFATDMASFKDLRIHFSEKPNKKELREYLINCDFDEYFPFKSEKESAVVSIVKEENNPLVYFYTKEKDLLKKYPEKDIKEFIALNIFFFLIFLHVKSVYYFPTERSGLVSLINSKKEQNELKKLLSQKKFSYTEKKVYNFEPVSNLIHYLHTIQNAGDFDSRLKESEKYPEIKNYIEIANILQTEILDGNLDFSESKPDLPRELIYKVLNDDKIALEMHIASSMIKDSTPLILYLKYKARKGDLLVIDEPEMNLHPESQVKFIELITMLVNQGVKVIITTHSPYMVDHLANLIKAYKNENKEKILKEFFLKRKESFINCNNVSVYLFEKGRVKNILSKSGEINWDTFSRISEKIFQIQKQL